MTFNLKQTRIYRAVAFYRYFPAGLLRFYRTALFILGLLPLAGLLVDKFPAFFSGFGVAGWLNIGWTYIFLPMGFSVMFFELFGNYHMRYPRIGTTDNIAEFLEFEAADIFEKALRKSSKSGEKSLSTRVLILTMMEDRVTAKVITRLIPDFKLIKDELSRELAMNRTGIRFNDEQGISEDVMKVLEEAMKVMDEHGGYRISILDILAGSFEYNPEFRKFLLSRDFNKADLEELAHWYESIWTFWRESLKFWSFENLRRKPPIGKDWIYGYSPHLIAFAVNLTDKMEFKRPIVRLFARKKELEQIEDILARSGENNILLVGEEGVGKDEIISDFADMMVKGQALPQLNYKKVYDLNLSLVAGASKDISDVQNLLLSILNEASRSGNVILILKDFHNFIGEIGGLGRIDVSEILMPYLKSSNLQVIATTDPASFHKYIEGHSDISNTFERVNVGEPSPDETIKIIQESIPALESRFHVMVTYGAIKEVVSGADKFIRTSPFPEKAFDLLSEAISYSISNKIKLITKKEVDEVISRKTGVPLGPIAGEEKDKLTRLEELMHQELVGQNRAVEVVASTMRRLRTGLGKRGKPAGTFLFVGPTGVGKTLTAKILAKTYFGSAEKMLRFDMSEYQDVSSLDRFLGSTKTGEPGQFVSAVKDNPFSLILLDEIEKADKNVLNIFLQVFDEGRLTDVFGRKINFEQNIIIATSNAGAEYIRDMVKEGLDPSIEKEKILDVLIKAGHFRPELLNRFDEVVVFHPLSTVEVGKISGLLVAGLKARLKEEGYMFTPTQDIIDYVAKVGFDPQFGARPMERVIRDKVESVIAKKILDGSITKGTAFSISQNELTS